MVLVVIVAFFIGLMVGLIGGIVLISALVVSGENNQAQVPLNLRE